MSDFLSLLYASTCESHYREYPRVRSKLPGGRGCLHFFKPDLTCMTVKHVVSNLATSQGKGPGNEVVLCMAWGWGPGHGVLSHQYFVDLQLLVEHLKHICS